MKLDINPLKCVRCELCSSVCIYNNISLDPEVHEVGNGLCFECGHCMAICPTGAMNLKSFSNKEEYIEKYDTTESPVNTDDFIELLKHRRSIRWFKNQKITEDEFNKLFEAASFSPSAKNIQDIEYVVIHEKLDEFMKLIHGIIKDEENASYLIEEYNKYIEGNSTYKKDPILWDGKYIILVFSKDHTSATIASTRIELTACTMNLGGFYNRIIQMADKIDHEKLMSFFPDIDPEKHMYSVFVIGHPRKKFKKTIPPRKIKVTYN